MQIDTYNTVHVPYRVGAESVAEELYISWLFRVLQNINGKSTLKTKQGSSQWAELFAFNLSTNYWLPTLIYLQIIIVPKAICWRKRFRIWKTCKWCSFNRAQEFTMQATVENFRMHSKYNGNCSSRPLATVAATVTAGCNGKCQCSFCLHTFWHST